MSFKLFKLLLKLIKLLLKYFKCYLNCCLSCLSCCLNCCLSCLCCCVSLLNCYLNCLSCCLRRIEIVSIYLCWYLHGLLSNCSGYWSQRLCVGTDDYTANSIQPSWIWCPQTCQGGIMFLWNLLPQTKYLLEMVLLSQNISKYEVK